MNTPSLLHLTTGERRCPRSLPAAWQPPVPAYVADLAGVQSAAICSLGVQSRDGDSRPLRQWWRERFTSKAVRVEEGSYTDADGFRNDVLICYFPSPEDYQQAWAGLARWWDDPARLVESFGYWRETFIAPTSHRETLFSASDRPAGLSVLSGSPMLGPVAEHGYWGGARDRMPASAHDEFGASDCTFSGSRPSIGRRLLIKPPENLCTIRSAQDFTDCTGRERELYTQRVHPTLIAGMQYLRDHPQQSGCYSCRFMTEIDESGAIAERTFALASFASLGHLERWAHTHPSHLAIFNGFLAMAAELGNEMRLRLWHEVFVLPAGQDHAFEYLNCHPRTGLISFVDAAG